MASPQLENGFAMIASELVAAIFIADFTKYEKVILADLILALYGPKKMPSESIDHMKLAKVISIDPRIVRRAIKSLLAKNVIVEHDDATYSFVKNWETWLRDPGPRNLIGDGERHFIAYSSARFSAKVKSTHKSKTGTNESPTDHSDRQKTGTNESPSTTVKGTGWSPMVTDENYKHVNRSLEEKPTSVAPLAGGRVRASEIPEDLIQECAKAHTNSRAGEDDLEPFMSPVPATPPPAAMDPAERPLYDYMLGVTATAEYPAGREDMAEHAIREFRSWVAQGYTVAIVKSAIHKSIKNGRRSRTDAAAFSSYAQGVLNGFAADRAALPGPPAPPAPYRTKLKEYLEPIEVPDHLKRTKGQPPR